MSLIIAEKMESMNNVKENIHYFVTQVCIALNVYD